MKKQKKVGINTLVDYVEPIDVNTPRVDLNGADEISIGLNSPIALLLIDGVQSLKVSDIKGRADGLGYYIYMIADTGLEKRVYIPAYKLVDLFAACGVLPTGAHTLGELIGKDCQVLVTTERSDKGNIYQRIDVTPYQG